MLEEKKLPRRGAFREVVGILLNLFACVLVVFAIFAPQSLNKAIDSTIRLFNPTAPFPTIQPDPAIGQLPDTERLVTVTLNNGNVLKGVFSTVIDSSRVSRWSSYTRYHTPHNLAMLFWPDWAENCKYDTSYSQELFYPYADLVPIDQIHSLEFLKGKYGTCGGGLVRVTFTSGEVYTKTLISRREENFQEQEWIYGSWDADQVVILMSYGPVSVELSEISSIVFEEATLRSSATLKPLGDDLGRISFVSDRDGNMEIYIMNADGSGLINLTNSSEDDCFPSWSPNGMQVAFLSRDLDGTSKLFVMNADGSGRTRLGTYHSVDYVAPRWSPDGTQISLSASTINADYSKSQFYYIINVNGLGPDIVVNHQQLWSSDSSKQINLFAPDLGRILEHALSPNGTRVAFITDFGHVYMANVDGSGMIKLTSNLLQFGSHSHLVWSPDSTRIAFASRQSEWNQDNSEIYVMNADGSGEINMTSLAAIEEFKESIVWSPDSRGIVFVSKRDGNWDVYIINIDGSAPINLTNNPASDRYPVWLP